MLHSAANSPSGFS